jgi:hypothetical protein
VLRAAATAADVATKDASQQRLRHISSEVLAPQPHISLGPAAAACRDSPLRVHCPHALALRAIAQHIVIIIVIIFILVFLICVVRVILVIIVI